MRRALAPILIACSVAFGACTTAASRQPSPSAIPIKLRLAPSNLGCDLQAVSYRSVTFRIEAAAPEQVVAIADNGESLLTFWSAGFTGGSSADPVVRDPARSPVAKDGELLPIPVATWPRLAGHFVCPAATAIYILLVDPR